MKISFSDFWGGFQYNNNFFIDLLKSIRDDIEVIQLCDDTDVLIYSCFGSDHYRINRTKTKKIFYTGENIRPNFNDCDYSLTFDFDTYENKNFRLPLWMLQIDWFNKKNYENPQFVLPYEQIEDNVFINTPKTRFCCTVFNTDSPFRFETLVKLSRYKHVDAFGKLHSQSIPYGEDCKYSVISNYKFSICFENTSYPGYYTEKLFHAKTAGNVPIYWGDENICKDFNTKCFINLHDFKNNVDDLVSYIKMVDENNDLYNSYKMEPLFTKQPSLDSILHFMSSIIK
jgi:hypothetical protein